MTPVARIYAVQKLVMTVSYRMADEDRERAKSLSMRPISCVKL